MKRSLYASAITFFGILALAGCGGKVGVNPSGSTSTHGTINIHGVNGGFGALTTAPSAVSTTFAANSVDTDSAYSVGFTLSPKPAGVMTYDVTTATSGSSFPTFVVLTTAAKSGSIAKQRYYGVAGEKIQYNNGTISTSGLSEFDVTNGSAIPGNGKLVFTVK